MKINSSIYMQAKEWCQNLGIEFNEQILPYYKKGNALYKKMGTFVIDKDRLIKYNNKYNIFRKWFDDVLLACGDISHNESLLVYIYTLIEIMKAKENTEILKTPDFNCRATDFAPLFSFMYFLDDMILEMKKRGCSHEIISDTLNGFDSEMSDYYKAYGRSGMRIYIAWFMFFLNGKILRIGKLQFEIKKLQHKIRVFKKNGDVKIFMNGENMHSKGMVFGSKLQDDEIGKYYADISVKEDTVTGYIANEVGECIPQKTSLTGYTEVLREGDYVISVHIPSDGTLDYEACEKSYMEAERIFTTFYPEYKFKAFACFSWLMEKRLKLIVGRETNITRFADEYVTYPLRSNGNAVYIFLYNLQSPQQPNTLPENTSMQSLVKKYLADGNVFYEKGGIRLFRYTK